MDLLLLNRYSKIKLNVGKVIGFYENSFFSQNYVKTNIHIYLLLRQTVCLKTID